MNTATADRLEVIRDTVKPTPAERVWRDGIIAREVRNQSTSKDRLADLTGLGIPQVNRIARTVEPAPADDVTIEVESEGVTFHVIDATKPEPVIDAELSRAVSEDLADVFGTGTPRETSRLVVKSVRKQKAAKPAPVADSPRRTGGFEKAPEGGHVPPRARKIRSTGSVIEFGHAADMGILVDEAFPWVARCLTHSSSSTWKTRGEARYQDGTDFCMGCAEVASA